MLFLDLVMGISPQILLSINAAWDEERKLPIPSLFIAFWARIMETMHIRRHRKHQSDRITDCAKGILDVNFQDARKYRVSSSKDGLAQAFVPNGNSYVVNMGDQTCHCGHF